MEIINSIRIFSYSNFVNSLQEKDESEQKHFFNQFLFDFEEDSHELQK